MAAIDFTARTIELNLAYFGALQAGCGTNVRHLHRAVPARERSELRRVGGADRQERMWHFAYQPLDPPKLPGWELHVRVCSIPSGPDLALDRDSMVAGIDGVVLVADARAGRTEANLAAVLDLEEVLQRHGEEIGALPMVFQVNQTDAQNARPAERVVEDLNPFGLPVFNAMARQGKGVIETHDAILASVLTRLRDNLPDNTATVTLTSLSRAARTRAEDAVVAHASALPQAERQMPATVGLPTQAEIPVRVAALQGSLPVHHLRTTITGPRVRVEAIFRRHDGSQRKVALLVEAGEPEVAPRTSASAKPSSDPPAAFHTRPLPPSDEIPGELPRLVYGFGGLLGGLLAGFFAGYLLFG